MALNLGPESNQSSVMLLCHSQGRFTYSEERNSTRGPANPAFPSAITPVSAAAGSNRCCALGACAGAGFRVLNLGNPPHSRILSVVSSQPQFKFNSLCRLLFPKEVNSADAMLEDFWCC
jgi:hypothetical protein